MGNDSENVIDTARTIGELKITEAVPYLLKVLEETNDRSIRDSVAVALSDIKAQEAFAPIVSLLKDPKTAGARGTLLYALEPFDCREIFGLLVEFVCEEHYEARHQAASLIFNMKGGIDREIWSDSIRKLKKKYVILEDQFYLVDDVLNHIKRKKFLASNNNEGDMKSEWYCWKSFSLVNNESGAKSEWNWWKSWV